MRNDLNADILYHYQMKEEKIKNIRNHTFVSNMKKSRPAPEPIGNQAQHSGQVVVPHLGIPPEIESLNQILFVIAISLLDEMYSPDSRYLAMLKAKKRIRQLGINYEDFMKIVDAFDTYQKHNQNPIERVLF